MKSYKNLQRSNSGFSIIEVLLVFIVIIAVVAAGVFFYNNKKNNEESKSNNQQTGQNNDQKESLKNESDLVIYNFGVKNLESIDVTQNATRDFKASGHKGFYIFGDILPGTPVRHNPNFEFASIKEGTEIVAAIDGIVAFIKEQPDSKDSEVFLMTSEQSNWVIGYDHLTDLKVKKGDKVKVGDVLGVPARQNNGLLRYEFQINKKVPGQDDMHICPSTLLASDVKDGVLKQLAEMQNAWESTTGLELYDITKQQPVGCIGKEMTPAYANGTN